MSPSSKNKTTAVGRLERRVSAKGRGTRTNMYRLGRLVAESSRAVFNIGRLPKKRKLKIIIIIVGVGGGGGGRVRGPRGVCARVAGLRIDERAAVGRRLAIIARRRSGRGGGGRVRGGPGRRGGTEK